MPGEDCTFSNIQYQYLKVNILYSSPSEYAAKPEFLMLEINIPGAGALLFCACYRPPKIGHLADVENALLRFLPHYRHVLITGDFNTNLLSTTGNYEFTQLTTMFTSCNLTALPFGPTHHTAESHTLLDLMITSDMSTVVDCGQLPVPGMSRHDLIFCILSIKVPKPKSRFITYRNFRCMDEASFMTDVYSTPWDTIKNLPTVNDMVTTLNSYILALYDKHAPIVTKRVNKKHPVPWMTPEILNLMAQRDAAYRRAKRSSDSDLYDQYKHLRNRVKQLLRNSRLRYTQSLFFEKQSSSSLWRNVKKLGLGKQENRLIDIPLDDLNNHFASLSQQPTDPEVHISRLHEQPSNQMQGHEFKFKPVLPADVLLALRRISSNMVGFVCGSDGISILMIKKYRP